MRLIPVVPEDLMVGKPLPWPLFDEGGELMIDKGAAIESESHLLSLLGRKPMRKLSWQGSATDTELNTEPTPELDAAMAGGNTDNRFSFADMRLRVGDRLQLQPPANVATDRYVAKLIGYLDNNTVLVTAPYDKGLRVPLRENDTIVARIFSGLKVFGFSTTIERVCKIPFDYLHLAFPAYVQGSVIRKSPRVRTRIIASISTPDAESGSDRHSGLIANLSADGALVRARQPLAQQGAVLGLSFRVNLHSIDAYLTVNAVVRSTFADEGGRTGDSSQTFSHGVQFQDLAPNDSVILQSLIYQQMIEQPHTVT